MADTDFLEVVRPHEISISPKPIKVVGVSPGAPDAQVVLLASRGAIGPMGPPGPQGIPGDYEGTAWWYAAGPPGTIVGAKPGDYYLDTASGTVYKLGD